VGSHSPFYTAADPWRTSSQVSSGMITDLLKSEGCFPVFGGNLQCAAEVEILSIELSSGESEFKSTSRKF
jgi:hypothetical protein